MGIPKTIKRVGKSKLYVMKFQELNAKELTEINGGGLFGGNDSASSSGLGGALNIGNLLSFSNQTQDGDESSSTQFSLGNNIGGSLAGLFESIRS
jgi:bacteriocin-like protein